MVNLRLKRSPREQENSNHRRHLKVWRHCLYVKLNGVQKNGWSITALSSKILKWKYFYRRAGSEPTTAIYTISRLISEIHIKQSRDGQKDKLQRLKSWKHQQYADTLHQYAWIDPEMRSHKSIGIIHPKAQKYMSLIEGKRLNQVAK